MPRKKKETSTSMEVQSAAEMEKDVILQTDLESEKKAGDDEDHNTDDSDNSSSHQTEIENALVTDGDTGDDSLVISNCVAEPDGSLANSDNQNQSGTEAVDIQEASDASEGMGSAVPRNTRSARLTSRVLTIDERLSVETESEKAKNDFLDLLESKKTGRILSGTIQGVERGENVQGISYAVIYHGDYKVIIPADEAVTPPDDFRGQRPEDVMHYLITKRLGAEIDYVVKGIDDDAGVAVASRLEAMRAKCKEYYLGSDRDGNNIIYSGINAEARIVSVIRAGVFVDLFGIEVYIPLKELSYQRWMDAQAYFQPGQRIIVKILSVDRTDRNNIKVEASVKQATENPYEKALKRYSVGNRYVGTVSMVDTNGVFVALDGGVDCLCQYPKRGRPPRGSRVTVRILGINEESNRIWGAITHIAAAR